MSELSLHGIKKIEIKHEFCESTGDYQEFSTIQIYVEGNDPAVKRLVIKLFINPDAEISFNGFLAYQRGMELKKNEPVEDPLDEEIVNPADVFPDEEKEDDDGGNE